MEYKYEDEKYNIEEQFRKDVAKLKSENLIKIQREQEKILNIFKEKLEQERENELKKLKIL